MQKKIKSNFFSSPCFSETCESWIIILYLPPGKQSVWVWALILSVTAKQCCKMSETDQKKDPPHILCWTLENEPIIKIKF